MKKQPTFDSGAWDIPMVSKEELLGAIREGVRDALWRMITNATDMPCHDFYDTVKEGAAAGIKESAQGTACESGRDK
jgi:hypothetical protein